ncbi:MAG: DUF3798 domain-containing protein [Candidatus Eisenbacteria bacterium]
MALVEPVDHGPSAGVARVVREKVEEGHVFDQTCSRPGGQVAGFKIGIMTGTVSQNEEEFRAGQQLAARYGDRIKHVTYPDNFMQEQETVIAQLVGLAADPAVKVIVVGQAIPGTIAGARKIREQRPDILIGFVEPHEDPAMVNEAADIAVQPDQLERGRTIIAEAAAMGAKKFIHYSFPRHMSQELLARRRDIMKEACAEKGLDFQFVTAPDPMAEGGLPATQQFVLEDVPREVKKYGPQTAFFSTNCGMQDPLIRSVLANGGYVPEQCCPSPTHGYPTALGIAVPPDKAGDIAYINSENRRIIAEHNMTGHFGTWIAPESMVAIRAVTNLLVDAVEKKMDYKDQATVQKYLADEAGAAVKIRKYDEKQGNQYLFLLDHIVY